MQSTLGLGNHKEPLHNQHGTPARRTEQRKVKGSRADFQRQRYIINNSLLINKQQRLCVPPLCASNVDGGHLAVTLRKHSICIKRSLMGGQACSCVNTHALSYPPSPSSQSLSLIQRSLGFKDLVFYVCSWKPPESSSGQHHLEEHHSPLTGLVFYTEVTALGPFKERQNFAALQLPFKKFEVLFI